MPRIGSLLEGARCVVPAVPPAAGRRTLLRPQRRAGVGRHRIVAR